MPQFDQFTFLNQIFWLFFFFFSFYLIIVYFFLPKILSILKFRKKILQQKLNQNSYQFLQNKLNNQFFNNIYLLTYTLIFNLKNQYNTDLLKKIENINLFSNLNYNSNIFKILILKKILQK
jgi:hypothetical protein